MATETLPSGNFVADIRRAEGRWRLSLGTDKKRIAVQRKALLKSLADTEEGRAILDQLKARALKIDAVEEALAPGGAGMGALKPRVKGVTIAQACEAYLAGVTGRESTRNQVRSAARFLVRDLGGATPLSKVTKAQARAWLYRANWSPRTQAARHVYARAIFAEAKPLVNVWDEVRPKKVDEEREMAILSGAETHAFLAQLDTKLKAWMACGFLGGLRIGEACNLRWQDVDFDNATLHVKNRGGARKWVTKSGKSRLVDAPPELVEALARWREEKRGRGEYVFGMRRGPLAHETGGVWAKRAFESAGMVAGRANEGWTYHAGRHSAASNALRAGVPPAFVASWLGNTVEILLKTYSHVLEGDTRVVANALKNIHS